MELKRRSALIYGLLLGVWVLVVAWQVAEHIRVRKEARAALVNRAKDISTTLGIVLRSQRRFGGVVSKERLEASLTELVRQEKTELNGIALLNAANEMVASAGRELIFKAWASPARRKNGMRRPSPSRIRWTSGPTSPTTSRAPTCPSSCPAGFYQSLCRHQPPGRTATRAATRTPTR